MKGMVVLVTTPSKKEADKIVRSLLNKRLIACANIFGPVESNFWWKRKIDKASEFLVLMKSSEKLFIKLSQAIREMHSYEVPEILALPIVKGSKPYLEWLNASLTDSGEP